jgi:hypothetical protein
MNLLLRGCIIIGFVAGVAALSGCGSRRVETKSAGKEIGDAERFMDSAKSWESKGQLDLAITDYRQAKEAIFSGKSFAAGTELSKLNSMDDDVRKKLTDLQTKKMTIIPEPEKPKVVAVKSEDPEEKKRKELEAAKAKKEKEAAAAKQALTDSFATANAAVSKPKDKKEEEDIVAAPKAAAKDGDKTAEGGEAPEEKGPPALKPADGPYPAITDKSAPLEIVRLANKGNYVLGYFQLYNKNQNGRRIMGVSVFFKDTNNQPVINPQSTAVFQYSGFKADIKDPFDQSVPAVTAGSHQVTGFDGMRMVAVGEHARAGDIKKLSIKILFDDGSNVVETGPANAAAVDTVKGVKLK